VSQAGDTFGADYGLLPRRTSRLLSPGVVDDRKPAPEYDGDDP
jgi:hypothetical protein